MKYHIIVADDVHAQLYNLTDEIEEERAGYGMLLSLAYQETLAFLGKYPCSHRKRKGNWRIIQIKNFNYILVYKVYADVIYVSKLVHARSGTRKKFRR